MRHELTQLQMNDQVRILVASQSPFLHQITCDVKTFFQKDIYDLPNRWQNS